MNRKAEYQRVMDQMIDKLKMRRYRESTQRTYIAMMKSFLYHTNPVTLDDIKYDTVMDYLKYLVYEKKVSPSYQNQSINAIKFYFELISKLEGEINSIAFILLVRHYRKESEELSKQHLH